MDRTLFYIGIAFFGMVNGIFNPLMAFSYVFSKVLMQVPLLGSESLIFYFAALMLSTATIILAGIPAAIYERVVGAKEESNVISLWIWLAGTGLLALPAVGNFLKIGLYGSCPRDCERDWPTGSEKFAMVADTLGTAEILNRGGHAAHCLRDRAEGVWFRFPRHFLHNDRLVL